mmetsp:Transcript_35367/g.63220  ORF Transcript_35367/g.63220 Transcript_35367/m.63220 type:complete len:234 (+) Transcript_35367:562-1263(+)
MRAKPPPSAAVRALVALRSAHMHRTFSSKSFVRASSSCSTAAMWWAMLMQKLHMSSSPKPGPPSACFPLNRAPYLLRRCFAVSVLDRSCSCSRPAFLRSCASLRSACSRKTLSCSLRSAMVGPAAAYFSFDRFSVSFSSVVLASSALCSLSLSFSIVSMLLINRSRVSLSSATSFSAASVFRTWASRSLRVFTCFCIRSKLVSFSSFILSFISAILIDILCPRWVVLPDWSVP